MKRLAIICSFLALSIGLCIYYFVTLTTYNERISKEIVQLQVSIENGTDATLVFSQLEQSLYELYSKTTVFLNKTKLTELKTTHAKIKTLLSQDDEASLLTEISTLKASLNTLFEFEKPTLQNIL